MAASTQPTPVGPEATRSASRWLSALIALIVGLSVGLGAGWLVFTPDSVNAEAEALVQDYVAAWDAGDPEAVLALMTDGAVLLDSLGPANASFASLDGTDSIAYKVDEMSDRDFRLTDDPTLSGSDMPITAWVVMTITVEEFGYEPIPGLLTLTIEDIGGNLLISQHKWDPDAL